MVYNLAFTDEVWSCGGANNRSYVSVLIEGNKGDTLLDRYRVEFLTCKYSKRPSWMIHNMLYNGKKAVGMFSEKEI